MKEASCTLDARHRVAMCMSSGMVASLLSFTRHFVVQLHLRGSIQIHHQFLLPGLPSVSQVFPRNQMLAHAMIRGL